MYKINKTKQFYFLIKVLGYFDVKGHKDTDLISFFIDNLQKNIVDICFIETY